MLLEKLVEVLLSSVHALITFQASGVVEAWLPAVIGAGAALGGLIWGSRENSKSRAHADAQNMVFRNAEAARLALEAKEERKRQEEFAKSGIQWRVEDAKKAGIHPLAALGASVSSPSPIQVGSLSPVASPDYSRGDFLSSMGQELSRGIMNTADAVERRKTVAMQNQLNLLTLERATLENQLLSSQVARLNQGIGPGLPSNSGMPLLTGQGNSYPTAQSMGGAYVTEKPLERIHSSPGRPAQEVGAVPDYGYARTTYGYSVVPSKDVKEKIEDQFVPEMMWAVRNQVMPNWGAVKGSHSMAPDPKFYPLPKGADAWRWSVWHQEFRPAKLKKGGLDYDFLSEKEIKRGGF